MCRCVMLAGSSEGVDSGTGRFLEPVCTAESIACLWWLCHYQQLVSVD